MQKTLEMEELPQLVSSENFQRWFCRPRLWTLESFCTYLTLSTAVYAAFLDPLRHNACRSCLSKMFWLIVHFGKCRAHVGNVLFTFFCLFFFFQTSFLIWWVFQCHEEGTDFYKQTFVSLVQNTSILMKKWQQWVFIDVTYYSTAFFFHSYFQRTCLTFLPFALYIILLEWSCRATKLLYFLHNSHFYLLLKNNFCHPSHFDSLPLWIIKTFF